MIKKKKGEVEFEFSFDLKRWEDELEKAYKATAGKYKVQGFRAGKAPRGVIEKNYGTDVFLEPAISNLMNEAYGKMLKDDPTIKPVDYPGIDYKLDSNGITITGSVPVEPEFTLGKYTGHKISKEPVNVTDKDIDNYISQMQARRGRQVDAKDDYKAKNGDIAIIDFVGSVGGVEFPGGKAEDYELVLGSNSFIDTFEKQLEGTKKGDKKDVKVTFPKEYHSTDLAGKEALFKVTVKKIMVNELPEINDAFAKESSEFNTLAKWREGIKKELTETAEIAAINNAENTLIEKVVTETKIDIPQSLMDRQVDRMVQDMAQRVMQQLGIPLEAYLEYAKTTMEKMRADMKPQAEANIKTRLVFDAIADKEGIDAPDGNTKLDKILDLLKEKNEIC